MVENMNEEIPNRPRALITGAAKRIGAAVATHLASRGCDIVLHCHHSLKDAEALSEKLHRTGARVTILRQDLSKIHALKNFYTAIPPCDILIHNASVFMRDDIHTMEDEVLEAHMRVNMMAPLLLTQGFAKQLPNDRHGSVVMLSDGVMGWSLSPHFFSYAASKLSLDGCVDLLAAALAPAIRVNGLALGPTLENENDTSEMFQRLADRSPLKENSTTADVLCTIDYLLDSPTVTGQTISIASGMQLKTKRLEPIA